jgi:hypothetical protein
MTPRVLEREFEAARLRANDAYRKDLAQAWNVARFNAATKSKKGLQPLSKYLDEVKERSTGRPQTPEEMKFNVELMSAMYKIPLRRKGQKT